MTEGRFGGIARLYSEDALARLAASHVCVVGLGGVGSWVAEALARSGVGALTLVDADDVCETNINRQLLAVTGSVGRPKAEVLAARVADINPACRVTPVPEFFHLTNADQLLAPRFDFVVDAVDRVMAKVCLIGHCHAAGTPIVTCGGAGGRTDPFQIQCTDLAATDEDPLLAYVRKKLRRIYSFPAPGTPFGVPCVFSREPIRWPEGCAPTDHQTLTCDTGIGAAAHVTGVFGLMMAGVVVNRLAGNPSAS